MTNTMKILYIDMDNVLVDFPSAFPHLDKDLYDQHEQTKTLDEVHGIFSLMNPYEYALISVKFLAQHFDLYLLSTAPWENPSAWSDKLLWVKKHLPEIGYKRLIMSHNKHLNKGDYLIDDRLNNGADRFEGEHVHFGKEKFPDWAAVVSYLCEKEAITPDVVWGQSLSDTKKP